MSSIRRAALAAAALSVTFVLTPAAAQATSADAETVLDAAPGRTAFATDRWCC